MESAEHLFQMLVMSVLVWATNIDVVTDVFNTGNTIDCVTHFLLEDFCSTRETKVQTLVAKEPNMGGECGQWSRIGVKRDLMVSLIIIRSILLEILHPLRSDTTLSMVRMTCRSLMIAL